MLSDAASLVDTTYSAGELPKLICETRLERQAANIENWIKTSLPVQSAGFSIHGDHNGSDTVYANNSDQHTFEYIEMQVRERNKACGRKLDEALLFEFYEGVFSSLRTEEDDQTSAANGIAFDLTHQGTPYGMFFLIAEIRISDSIFREKKHLSQFISIVSSFIYNALCHQRNRAKERFFSVYETVSSSLCYAGDLQELLTTIISIIVSELPSEEGSILLYDDDANTLKFFSAMGETGSGFIECSFPADKGIAGKALQGESPIIVNDVKACPYFFGDFDNQSGFVTKSILAAPIISGGERVGVVEAINKVGKDSFDETDKGIMIAIADEVGLAVKNARMFDYVVKSYCKLKQGKSSCKGCERPLRSWTPCARQLDLL